MTIESRASRGWIAASIAAASLAFAPAAQAQTNLPPPGGTSAADQRQDRIEALEAQLREATAENERLQHQLILAQREIARLQQMTGELAAANSSLQESDQPAQAESGGSSPAPAPTPPGDQSSASQTVQQAAGLSPAQQRAQGTLGDMSASAVPASTPPAPPPPADPGAVYGAARQLLLNGQVAEAEAAFAEFLRDYGDAEMAPDARYWLAFTLLARNNYQSAAASFVDYLQRYPRGARAPEAQVRLGMALAGLGQTRQACAAFRDVPSRYPNASRAVRDLATRESRASNCQA